ncbi:unnamed protein product [Ectocarpus sp. 6 AP-2014]
MRARFSGKTVISLVAFRAMRTCTCLYSLLCVLGFPEYGMLLRAWPSPPCWRFLLP